MIFSNVHPALEKEKNLPNMYTCLVRGGFLEDFPGF
jgi:hypothetical protein